MELGLPPAYFFPSLIPTSSSGKSMEQSTFELVSVQSISSRDLFITSNFNSLASFSLRIATKTLEHTFCSCLDILFDTHSPFGQHRVQQQVLLEHSNFASGTRVSLYMPLPPGSHALSYGEAKGFCTILSSVSFLYLCGAVLLLILYSQMRMTLILLTQLMRTYDATVIDMLDVYFDRLSVMPSSSVATTASSKNRNATLVISTYHIYSAYFLK